MANNINLHEYEGALSYMHTTESNFGNPKIVSEYDQETQSQTADNPLAP